MSRHLREPRSALQLSVFLTSPRYEEEINKRTNIENEFADLKKVKEKEVPRGSVDTRDWVE